MGRAGLRPNPICQSSASARGFEVPIIMASSFGLKANAALEYKVASVPFDSEVAKRERGTMMRNFGIGTLVIANGYDQNKVPNNLLVNETSLSTQRIGQCGR